MQELFATVKRWYNHAQEAEKVYTLLKSQGEPAPLLVLLPLCYKRVTARTDERFNAFLGQYLGMKYPLLREYFLGKEHQESLASLRKTLDDFFANDDAGVDA